MPLDSEFDAAFAVAGRLDSRRVVYALTGDLAFTALASFRTKWLRRMPVRRGLVRFFGLPIENKLLSIVLLIELLLSYSSERIKTIDKENLKCYYDVMSDLAPRTPNYLSAFTFRRWIGGCIALASVIAVADAVTTDPSESRPAVYRYEVTESNLLWNVAADLARNHDFVDAVRSTLSRDNPAIPEDNIVRAGTMLDISDAGLCQINQDRVVLAEQ
ncbi:MAG TPA: hypothetical protein VK963_01745 [Candidatus Saccharimonadales bacterium]|nr:hypothetical protein [Candidatus Saccharimonadales bacterium]